MRYTFLILIAITAGCAEERKAEAPAPKAETVKEIPHAVTADDLQNLIVCARRQLPGLTADEIATVAAAIKHAEADIETMRAAATAPPTAEDKAKAK